MLSHIVLLWRPSEIIYEKKVDVLNQPKGAKHIGVWKKRASKPKTLKVLTANRTIWVLALAVFLCSNCLTTEPHVRKQEYQGRDITDKTWPFLLGMMETLLDHLPSEWYVSEGSKYERFIDVKFLFIKSFIAACQERYPWLLQQLRPWLSWELTWVLAFVRMAKGRSKERPITICKMPSSI